MQSKKDSTINRGCFNCKGLENGERKNFNFNKVNWGLLGENDDDSSVMEISFYQTDNGGSEGETENEENTLDRHRTPVRGMTPVWDYPKTPGYPLKPPVKPKPVRTRKVFTFHT